MRRPRTRTTTTSVASSKNNNTTSIDILPSLSLIRSSRSSMRRQTTSTAAMLPTLVKMIMIATSLAFLSVVDAQTSFLGGKYVALTNVNGIAKLANDIASIKAAASIDDAKNILGVGSSVTATATDPKTNAPLTIMGDIGTSMVTEMDGEPYYHVFTFAMNKLNSIPDSEVAVYSNAILSALLDSVQNVKMVAESAVVNTLWMQHVHYLEQALQQCTDGQAEGEIGYYLDVAFATYVGNGQQLGVAGSGHSLYDIAEQAATLFGTKSSASNQALVNEYITTLYNDLQTNFAKGQKNMCLDNPIEASKRMRIQIHKIVQQSVVPLVQKMLYHLEMRNENASTLPATDSTNVAEKDYAEIYALQIFPLLSMCHVHDADLLRDLLIQPADKTQAVDVSNVLNLIQRHYDCMGFTCSDIGSYLNVVDSSTCATVFDGTPNNGISYGGYVPSTDIIQKSKLDLDVLLVGILLTENKPLVARDVINKGWNSKIEDTQEWASSYISTDPNHKLYRPHVHQSLSQLAQADGQRSETTLPGFNDFVSYFNNNEDYAYKLLVDGISKASPLSTSSPTSEVMGYIMETLHLVVSHHAALEALFGTVDVCTTQGNTASTRSIMESKWNEGAALILGSLERGASASEQVSDEHQVDGQFMFSMVKRNCNDFDVCDTLPKALTDALMTGLTSAQKGNCENLKSSAETIQGMLQAVVIQTIMIQAKANDDSSSRSARGHIAVRALTPLMNDANAVSQLEQEMNYADSGLQVTNSDYVFNLLRVQAMSALPNVKCEWVGAFDNGTKDFCQQTGSSTGTGSTTTTTPNTTTTTSTTTPQDTSSPSNALIDYIPTTNVEYILGFSDDLEEMRNAATTADAKAIFVNGKNAWHKSGGPTDVYSLADLSSSAYDKMKYEPIYNMYLYVLKNVPALLESDGYDANEFAKTTVLDVFSELEDYYGDEKDDHVAAGAAKLLIMFLEMTHGFYKAAEFCDSQNASEQKALAEAIDGAVAFYVGRNQQKGDSNTGVSLYNLSQKAGDKFKTINPTTGESFVNEFVMTTFQKIQTEIVKTDICQTTNPFDANSGSTKLLKYANDIVDQIKVMITQGLIYNFQEENYDVSEVFGIALTPFVSMCDYDKGMKLTELTIKRKNKTVDPPALSSIVSLIESVYSCMGFSCQDVGSLLTDDGQTTLSGQCAFEYTPSEKPQYQYVRRIDRFVEDRYVTLTDQTKFGLILNDIRDIVDSTTTAEAKSIFQNGKNTMDGTTLATLNNKILANVDGNGDENALYKQAAQWLGTNVDAFDVDSNNMADLFGAQIVTDIFDELETQMGDTDDDNFAGEAIIVTIVSHHVWYLLQSAVTECQDVLKTDLTTLAQHIDRAAMLYIGQDQTYGNDKTGYSFYRLAEYTADSFDTNVAYKDEQSGQTESRVNNQVLMTLEDIKQEFLLTNVCLEKPLMASKSLQLKVNTIINQMKTVIIQGFIQYIDETLDVSEDDDDKSDQDFTEVYALMIAPMASSCDASLGQDMLDNLIGPSDDDDDDDDDSTRRGRRRLLQGRRQLKQSLMRSLQLDDLSSALDNVVNNASSPQTNGGLSNALQTNMNTAANRDDITTSGQTGAQDSLNQITESKGSDGSSANANLVATVTSIVSKLQAAYDCMKIDCLDVGNLVDATGTYGFCDDDGTITTTTGSGSDGGDGKQVSDTTPSTMTDSKCYLAGYCPTYDAEYLKYLQGYSLDLRDMANANDSAQAKSIFNKGLHAIENGASLHSLSTLSDTASEKMTNEFYYNMWQYALRDVAPLNDPTEGETLNVFGKTIVNDVLDELSDYYGFKLDDNMAAEAAKLHVILLEVIHGLYATANECAKGDSNKVELALDGAVSFYVGLDQRIGSHTSGYSLYNLAEKLSELYNQDATDSGECRVNTKIMTTFKDMQAKFVTNKNYCVNNPESASAELLEMAHTIINQIKVVAVQGLIHYMHAEDAEYAELYGLIVTPLVAVCDYKAATSLKDMLIHHHFDSSDMSNVLDLIQNNYSCMGISCQDVGTYGSNLVEACTLPFDSNAQPYKKVMRVDRLLDGTWTNQSDRGYFTLTDQTKYGGLLDDIRDIVQATDISVAQDIFINGKNDKPEGRTIAEFSSNQAASDMSNEIYYTTFEKFLKQVPTLQDKSDVYGAEIVKRIFTELQNSISETKDVQMAGEAVILMIVSMEIWHLLANAVLACGTVGEDNQTIDDVASMVDKAAMLYIGMDQTYGSENTGYSFYRLAEYTADQFGTKALDGQSLVNREVLQAFDNIKQQYLLTGYCGSDQQLEARDALMDQAMFIIDQMKATMVQGFISNAAEGEKRYAELYALQVTPLLSMCDVNVANNILDTFVLKKSSQLPQDTTAYNNAIKKIVIDTMSSQYNCMRFSCEDIGTYTTDDASLTLSQCTDSSSTLLGYETTTSIDYLLDFTRDVYDMVHATTVEEARTIFVNGKHSMNQNTVRPLTYLSTDAKNKMANEPYYNLYLYALNDIGALNSDDTFISEFAKTIVLDVFDELDDYYSPNTDDNIAAAGVVLHMFIPDIIHALYAAANQCADGNTNMVAKALDSAMALYVGVDQEEGDVSTGTSVYHVAEKMSRYFPDTLDDDGTFVNNRFIVNTFKQLQKDYVLDATPCDSSPAKASADLLQKAHLIINKLKVLLIHGMQRFMYEGDHSKMKLFALGVIPFVSACDYELSQDLADKLVKTYTDLEVTLYDDIVERLQDQYSCMGIQCQDVGRLTLDGIDVTAEPCLQEFDPSLQPFKTVMKVEQFLDNRYFTLTDQTDYNLVLDDIRDIVKASSTAAARQVLENGKEDMNNGKAGLSLAKLSQEAPTRMKNEIYYSKFVQYLGTNVPAIGKSHAPTYGLQIVEDILAELEQVEGTKDDVQMAGEAVILHIVSMEIWHYLAQTVLSCRGDTAATDDIAMNLDRAAMLYIGQDQTYGSSDTGYAFYRLAEYTGEYFGTELDGDEETKVNDFILQKFNELKQTYVLSNVCQDDPKTASTAMMNEVELMINQMKTVMVQGFLMYAADGDREYAETYALQLTPLLGICVDTVAEMDDASVTSVQSDILDKFIVSPVLKKSGNRFLLEMQNSSISSGVPSLRRGLQNNVIIGVAKQDSSTVDTVSALPSTTNLDVSAQISTPNSSSTISGASSEASDALMSVLDDLQASYACMGLKCSDIGTYQDDDTGVYVTGCKDEKIATAVSNLGGYATTSDDYATYLNLSMDIRDIRAAGDNYDKAKSIYEEGKHAYGPDGELLTLATMNRDFDWTMSDEPWFNFFKYSLNRVGPLSGKDHDVSDYAHTIVSDVFDELKSQIGNAKDVQFAADAIVATHFWMQLTHKLFEAIHSCENPKLSKDDVASAFDDAVALYIGNDDAKTGGANSLYALVREMANVFGTSSKVHTRIMSLFDSMQYSAVFSDGCSADRNANNDDPTSVSILHEQANEIVSLLTVPLFQKLIYYMVEEDSHYMELYALTVTPLIATCDEHAARQLQDMLVLHNRYSTKDWDDIMGYLMPSFMTCMRLTCDDVGTYDKFQCNDGSAEASNIVGQTVSSNVAEYLRLDLDIRQVGMLMSIGAYQAAEYIVEHGQNVEDFLKDNDKALWSYKVIAREHGTPEAIDFILSILNRQTPYERLEALHATSLVTRTLQLSITHQVMMNKLNKAVTDCDATSKSDSVLWDEALALYVGSIEGTEAGGDPFNRGEMMYSLAKETCHTFGTCGATDGDSSLNQEILAAFKAGASLLKSGTDCASLAGVVETITGLCNTVLIQATLFYLMQSSRKVDPSDANTSAGDEYNSPLNKYYGLGSSSNSEVGAMAEVSVIAQALLPFLQSANPTSAATIQDATKYDPLSFSASSNTDSSSSPFQSRQRIQQAFDAFAAAIPNMAGVDCAKVGQVTMAGKTIGVCPVDDGDDTTADTADLSEVVNSPIDQDEAHDLSNGLYQTATNVKDRSYIANDVWDIAKSLQARNIQMAQNIYRQGLNSDLRDEDGMLTLTKRSIADFSLDASSFFFEELPYNTFVYALSDEYGYFEGAPASEYANSYVERIFTEMSLKSDIPPTLAAEAMVALHIWMAVVHSLYKQVEMCKRKANFATGRSSDFGGVLPIDIAAAYVIGDAQQTGEKESGHLIYNLAEQVGELFGQDYTGESRANTKIIKALNAIKSEVTLPDACANADTHIRLRTMADDTLSALTIPLMQQLIHSMKSKDLYRTGMYAISVVPLIAGCNEATYAYLRSELIDKSYDSLKFDDILTKLQSTYKCLGITCEDIGSYKDGQIEACEDPDEGSPISLAGYVPVSDVSEPSQIDLDVQQLRILMSQGAMSEAKSLYLYGRNSHKSLDGTEGELLSLQRISTNPTKNIAPTWNVYEAYKQDHSFSHSVVSRVFDDATPYDVLTPIQKEILISTGMTFMVMFIETLRHMSDAVLDCNAGDAFRNAHGTSSWDEAAASIIGSMEGTTQGGDPKNGGLFLYDIAKETCLPMNTCHFKDSNGGGGKSKLNSRLELLLYTGQSQLSAYDCNGLERTSKEVEGTLKTILLQAFLRDVAWLGGIPAAKIGSKPLLEEHVMIRAYARALSVEPFIYKVDTEAAKVIESHLNLNQPGVDPTTLMVHNKKKGPDAVFAAVARAISRMSDVECNDVGFIGGFDVCSDELVMKGINSAGTRTASFVLVTTLTLMFVSGASLMIMEAI